MPEDEWDENKHVIRVELPKLERLTRVSDAEILSLEGGYKILEGLRFLGFGCFKDTAGRHWFGVEDPSFSDHARWFIQSDQAPVDTWQAYRYRTVYDCGGTLSSEIDDFEAELDSTVSLLDELLSELENEPGWDEAKIRYRFLMQLFSFEFMGANTMHALMRARWSTDLHDIVHHWDEWAARTGFDLNRDLALRLHGMRAYADALAQGNDWAAIT